MSSSNSIINISTKNISGKCDLKCSYSFKYPSINLTVKNNQFMLTLTCDDTMPAVVFNEAQYNVSAINIYSPSLHLFNDTRASAELQIEHIPVKGGPNLYVCIPIIKSSDTTTASSLISDIIIKSGNNAPAKNDSFNLNTNNFSLQNIVPKAAFYNYTGTSNNKGEYIVYGMNNAIPLSEKILNILNKIIKPYNIDIKGNALFYNASGPNSNIKSQGIYISCQPTGSSKETTTVLNEKQGVSFDVGSIFKNLYNSSLFQILIIILVIGIVLFLFTRVFYYLTGKSEGGILQTFKIPKMKT